KKINIFFGSVQYVKVKSKMKVLYKLFITGLVLLSMSACSIKTDPLSKEESSSLNNKTLMMSKYSEKPPFVAQTAVNVQFGFLGVATAISNGNSMIKNNDIKDPAIEISRQLSDYLRSAHDVKVLDEVNALASSNEIGDLVNKYKNSDFILDVKTTRWGSIYYLSDWNNYRYNGLKNQDKFSA
ncbi:MAG: hypothetical protein COB42_07120, partial [Sulfurimonas sp.]